MLRIIQNDPGVPPGNIANWLVSLAVPFAVCPSYSTELPSLEDCSGLIILGGQMGAQDTQEYPHLSAVYDLVCAGLSAEIPLLGVCLGGQMLASVTGGRLTSGHRGERGLTDIHVEPAGTTDPLLYGLSPAFSSFQWHRDSFELPPQAVLLASNPVCPNQAFRLGRNAYGLQFHPEVDTGIVAAWSRKAGCEEQTLAAFAQGEKAYLNASKGLLSNFVALL